MADIPKIPVQEFYKVAEAFLPPYSSNQAHKLVNSLMDSCLLKRLPFIKASEMDVEIAAKTSQLANALQSGISSDDGREYKNDEKITHQMAENIASRCKAYVEEQFQGIADKRFYKRKISTFKFYDNLKLHFHEAYLNSGNFLENGDIKPIRPLEKSSPEEDYALEHLMNITLLSHARGLDPQSIDLEKTKRIADLFAALTATGRAEDVHIDIAGALYKNWSVQLQKAADSLVKVALPKDPYTQI